MKKIQKGFTLIELMIVIAIIGILAAIAIPAYNDYVTRSQVTEGLSVAAGMKTQVAEFHANNGFWPAVVADLPQIDTGVGTRRDRLVTDANGRYITQIAVSQGTLTITYGNNANANIRLQTLSVQPYLNGAGDVVWICGNFGAAGASAADVAVLASLNPSPSIPPGAPGTTVSTLRSVAGNTISDKYVPANCRT